MAIINEIKVVKERKYYSINVSTYIESKNNINLSIKPIKSDLDSQVCQRGVG